MFLNMVDTLVEGREFCRTLSPRRAQPLAEDGFYYSHLCTVGATIRCLEKSQTIPFWDHFRTWARAVERSALPRIVLQNSFCITEHNFSNQGGHPAKQSPAKKLFGLSRRRAVAATVAFRQWDDIKVKVVSTCLFRRVSQGSLQQRL
jgi:hypothetical protein